MEIAPFSIDKILGMFNEVWGGKKYFLLHNKLLNFGYYAQNHDSLRSWLKTLDQNQLYKFYKELKQLKNNDINGNSISNN